MKLLFTLILITFFALPSFTQSINCNELTDFIKSKGYRKDQLSNWKLNSSWLYSVEAYEYGNEIFVIATIKQNEYGLSSKEYIFCGVPSYNWSNFNSVCFDCSYGKRFHDYIMDYVCNCN